MATLDKLKSALRQSIPTEVQTRPLDNAEYSAGFSILTQGSSEYKDFVVPQLSQLLFPLFHLRPHISVLEIGPGPRSVLADLPRNLRRKIRRYAALEPNTSYASDLEECCKEEDMFPALDDPPEIERAPLDMDSRSFGMDEEDLYCKRFDLVLFCHSMYGTTPKHEFVEKAFLALAKDGLIVVFHRGESLHLEGLVCCQTASFPTGTLHVRDTDDTLDLFAAFVNGHVPQDQQIAQETRVNWRETCRVLASQDASDPSYLSFGSPTTMITFNQYANQLLELTRKVPAEQELRKIKSPEARHHKPAAIVKPRDISDIQKCVKWALKYELNLTVLGGGHSGQCLRSNVVAIDISAFDGIDIVRGTYQEADNSIETGSLAVVGAGCSSGDIIQATLAQDLTVPLGARPNVGAGLWLQGGIGHLARQYGLACDSIIGAVVVSVEKAEILVVGHVPEQHQPAGAIDLSYDLELLWALRGAGTNFGVVVNVVFKTYPAVTHSVRNWTVARSDNAKAIRTLSTLNATSSKFPSDASMDVFLYYDNDELQIGATLYEPYVASGWSGVALSPGANLLSSSMNQKTPVPNVVDSIGLFDTDIYVSGMHGGHGGGKTSAFKRCVFLKNVGAEDVAGILLKALKDRPSEQCYMHLLHGGGAVSKVAADATAFGCRDWDYACVITGIWPRELDGSNISRGVVQWVYDVANKLLPSSSGVYGADLGQDPRDAALADVSFGQNRERLGRLKSRLDPHNILPYACPLPQVVKGPKLIIIVTGKVCAGKDFCADVWAAFVKANCGTLDVQVKSISDLTKQEYATASDADWRRLLEDRAYKEEHREALTEFYVEQQKKRPWLAEEHFLNLVQNMDVLFITGMREVSPVATFAHLVSHSRVIEVHVMASQQTKQARGDAQMKKETQGMSKDDIQAITPQSHCPDLIFQNNLHGKEAARAFAENHLLPYLDPRYQELTDMVRSVSDFPRPGVEFRHILGINQHSGGINLCTTLFEQMFHGDWSKVNAIVSCESGGFLFSSPFALRRNLPLVLIREAGKLPPPTISSAKHPSHVSALASGQSTDTMIEMEQDVVPEGSSVVIVDDVLATGTTLLGVLKLLEKIGVKAEDITVMVVAEFPVHRGRHFLWQNGFGNVRIQSLLVFDGV